MSSSEHSTSAPTSSEGSSSKSRRTTAVTSLDDDELDAVVEHRYGTVPSDMTIIVQFHCAADTLAAVLVVTSCLTEASTLSVCTLL